MEKKMRIRNKPVVVGMVLIIAAFATACEKDAPAEPLANRTARAASIIQAPKTWRTLDEKYADLADSVPGFGGLFYDADGQLTVYMKNPSAFGVSTRTRLASLVRAQRGNHALPGDNNMNVLRGQYDFRELLTYYRTVVLPAIPKIEGITTSDIDEMQNRIVVGVSSQDLVSAATSRLADLPLPARLVQVIVEPPARKETTLDDYLRPVPGGAHIVRNDGTYDYNCTLGYSLTKSLGDTVETARYFVTNSHCTAQRNALDYTQMRQAGYYIGSEIGDPATFDNSYTSSCPVTFVCRFADAALFLYDSASYADQGRVAFPALNSTTFSIYLTITSVQSPAAGYAVNMIGSASGRRSGTTVSTCVDVWNITGWTNGWLLCQGKANYTSAGGDSGAPVIEAHGDGTAYAIGLHWGSNGSDRWYSPMDNVLQEFYTRLSGSPYVSPVTYP